MAVEANPISDDPRYKSKEWKDMRALVRSRAKGRCEINGCPRFGNTADHIVSPRNGGAFWETQNLRWLCADHDRQIKELPSGERRMGGKAVVRGCDASGTPIDPASAWHR